MIRYKKSRNLAVIGLLAYSIAITTAQATPNATITSSVAGSYATWQSCLEQAGIAAITSSHAKCFSEPVKGLATQILNNTIKRNLLDTDKGTYQEYLNKIRSALSDLPRGYHNELYFLAGYVNELLGDPNAALNNYKNSLSWNHYNAVTTYRTSVVLSLLKRHEESLHMLKEVIWLRQVIPPSILVNIGANLIALNHDELATPYLRQAADSAPPAATEARKLLVGMHHKLVAKAASPQEVAILEQNLLNLLQAIMYSNPNDRDTGLKLCQLLIANSDPLTGEANLNKASAISRSFAESSTYKDSSAVAMLVKVLVKQRRLDEANDVLVKGLKANPNSTELYSMRDQLELERAAMNVHAGKSE